MRSYSGYKAAMNDCTICRPEATPPHLTATSPFRRPELVRSIADLAIGLVRRQLLLITVDGLSMSPAVKPGDRLLARRDNRRLHVGDVVVGRLSALYVDHCDRLPMEGASPVAGPSFVQGLVANQDSGDVVPWPRATESYFIRRVSGCGGDTVRGCEKAVPDGAVWLRGDAPGSVDSDLVGAVPLAAVIGRVIFPVIAGVQHRRGISV